MRKIWQIKSVDNKLQKNLAHSLGISPFLAQLLINRDLTTPKVARIFLDGKLNSLNDPFELKDMDYALKRINRAIKDKEKIIVWGDYDCDGVTASALLVRVLKFLGANVNYYIPNRLDEGYGMNIEAIDFLHNKKTSLVITVDCGISCFTEIEYARKRGIDVIVTDHHKIADRLPDAVAIIDPLQDGCKYSYKYLAGVGIAYKLAGALCAKNNRGYENKFLDLVALGTIADIVPLTGENRILIKFGLEGLSNTENTGLRALIQACGLENKPITPEHVSFILAPRINAIGRMDSAETAIELLLTDSYDRALGLAEILDDENYKRQSEQNRILKQALVKVESEINFKTDRVLILNEEDWHPGVIGIVASKLVDRFYRPTIMLSFKEGVGRGSGRSIEGFHLFDAINNCSHLLERFGGHETACGLTIKRENLGEFSKMINNLAIESISDQDLIPKLQVEMDVPLSILDMNFINEIDKFSPFGHGNPRPVFSSRNLSLKSEPQIFSKDTLKLWVTDGQTVCEAVGFRMADYLPFISNNRLDIAYAPSINNWGGTPTIQLKLEDIKTG